MHLYIGGQSVSRARYTKQIAARSHPLYCWRAQQTVCNTTQHWHNLIPRQGKQVSSKAEKSHNKGEASAQCFIHYMYNLECLQPRTQTQQAGASQTRVLLVIQT